MVATYEELGSFDENNTLKYVQMPDGVNVIPLIKVFALKTDALENVIRFMTRLIAQGCRQSKALVVWPCHADWVLSYPLSHST